MSKIGYFLALKSEQLEALVREPASVGEFLEIAVDEQDELGGDFLDIDKSWQGIHFLLTGTLEAGEQPLGWAVFAPTAIGEDTAHGRARMLTVEQVAEVHKALIAIPADKLKRKCDWQLMNDREIYPGGWRAGDESYITDNFTSLKKFYEAAARKRMAVVQWVG